MKTTETRSMLLGVAPAIGVIGCSNTSGPKNTLPVNLHVAGGAEPGPGWRRGIDDQFVSRRPPRGARQW